MNEVVGLLADTSSGSTFEDARIRGAAVALGKAVLSRGARLLVYADSPTMALLAVIATEYRTVQHVETPERRIAPLIMAEPMRSDSIEDRLFEREQNADNVDDLERFGVVEDISADRERGVSWAYKRYSPIAIFLLGDSERLLPATEEALQYHIHNRVPLYSTIDSSEWTPIHEQDLFHDNWKPTVDGRFLEGEDLEIAMQADDDARVALALETIIERLIPRSR